MAQTNNYTTDNEELQRALAYERGEASGNAQQNLGIRLSAEQEARAQAWEAVAEEYRGFTVDQAGGSAEPVESQESTASEPAQDNPQAAASIRPAVRVDAAPELNVNQTSASEEGVQANAIIDGANPDVASPESGALDADAVKRIALIKRGAQEQSQFIQNATMQQLSAQYGAENVGDITLTDEQRAAYDDMTNQAQNGTNYNNVTAMEAITDARRMDGHVTSFDNTIFANGVSTLINDAKQPPAEAKQGLDVSELAMAHGLGNTVGTTLTQQVEAVQPLDSLDSDSDDSGMSKPDGVTSSWVAETMEALQDGRNSGFNSGNSSASDLTNERIDQADEQACLIDKLG